MVWTRNFLQIAFIFLVTMTVLALHPAGDAAQWIQLHDVAEIGHVEVLEAGENRLYAGTEHGIFVSDDQGRIWRQTAGSISYPYSMAIDGDTVYVGTARAGIFRSDDAGETWKPIRNGLITYERDDGELYWGIFQQMLVNFDEIIAVAYHSGTYVSNDKGETWTAVHDIWDWWGADSIYSMTQFNGYLWSAVSAHDVWRSSDNGRTWEWVQDFKSFRVPYWAVLNHRLYAAGRDYVGRWNEKTREWEYLMEGLPTATEGISSLAVHDGRLYTGLRGWQGRGGVYAFDAESKTWSHAGLDRHSVTVLQSHDSILYAGTSENGIYAATPQRVHPHAKAVTTWGRVKQDARAQD